MSWYFGDVIIFAEKGKNVAIICRRSIFLSLAIARATNMSPRWSWEHVSEGVVVRKTKKQAAKPYRAIFCPRAIRDTHLPPGYMDAHNRMSDM